MIKATDERLDTIVDLLQGYTTGLRIDEISDKLGLSYWVARKMMQVLGKTHRLTPVYIGHGQVVWATPRNAAPFNARLRAETKARSQAARREVRARNAKPAGPAKLYDNPDFNPDDVPDLPVRRRVVQCWAPLRHAPGPTSVFSMGVSHA